MSKTSAAFALFILIFEYFRWSSEYFYDGKLVADPTVANRTLRLMFLNALLLKLSTPFNRIPFLILATEDEHGEIELIFA